MEITDQSSRAREIQVTFYLRIAESGELIPHGNADAIQLAKFKPKQLIQCKAATESKRSLAQNRLQRKWLFEAAEQLQDQTAEEYRAYCKLHFGIPILRAESDKFMDVYDRLIRPHSYEEKLELMSIPFDFPVTRMMTVKQKTEYLNKMYQFFRNQGVELTEPPEKVNELDTITC